MPGGRWRGLVCGLGVLALLLGCRAPASSAGQPGDAAASADQGAAARGAATDPAADGPTAAGPAAVGPAAGLDAPPSAGARSSAATEHRGQRVAITVLSTSEAEVGQGEWGFCALVEVDGARILFDTGAAPQTVLRNAEAAGVDLTTVPQVVLSHHHDDHVGGLLTLRRAVAKRAPEALATVHVARGIFEPRRHGPKSHEVNDMIAIRPAFERTGGRVRVHDAPATIAPGVWVTGPVPRVHAERNFGGSRKIRHGDRWVEDTLPESQALVLDTEEGLVVISGCGHAGIVNIVTHARARIRQAPVRAAVGGLHLFRAKDDHLDWTVKQLQHLGVGSLYGAHCTGREAVARFGALGGEGTAREVAVGWTLTLPAP